MANIIELSDRVKIMPDELEPTFYQYNFDGKDYLFKGQLYNLEISLDGVDILGDATLSKYEIDRKSHTPIIVMKLTLMPDRIFEGDYLKKLWHVTTQNYDNLPKSIFTQDDNLWNVMRSRAYYDKGIFIDTGLIDKVFSSQISGLKEYLKNASDNKKIG